ncbi:MAG: NAD(P)-dependent alcohol dehydrogenase, partial [Gammaproteobacteria bacterium]
PWIMRPGLGLHKPRGGRLGVDFAGVIETVGANVKRFQPGDAVFGGRPGAFAEYISVPVDRALAPKPANLSFEQAASVPVAGVTALQALRDKGNVQAGQKVLINGAAGGVGTFAVQIAKSCGAEVTGVCSTRNLALARSIGADHIIDYTREDYTWSAGRYDLIVDMMGNHPLRNNKRALKPDGNLVIVGGTNGKWLGPLTGAIKVYFLAPFVSQHIGMMIAKMAPHDLGILRELLQAGKVVPVIDRSYRLSEVPDAIRYLEKGHARGKVVIAVAPENPKQP